ncbi:hypothetical protein ETAA8_40620 [Anatilimnocola aggregata]|uniref:Uncharacterized protein n=1 Tax=Anatilimnocola aggregata TaxID=2528021 RepID=A0A517YFF0_9BACT|nr:hypothetical protein ETAA8_40620 [Anatilimnocola aggregata]
MRPNDQVAHGPDQAGFLARLHVPLRIQRPDDDVLLDDSWLRSEGHLVHITNGVIVSLDNEDPQNGAVLVRTGDGWLFESPWPKYESVLLVPQPKTRGDLRPLIVRFKALRRLIHSLDIFDALRLGFITHGEHSPFL